MFESVALGNGLVMELAERQVALTDSFGKRIEIFLDSEGKIVSYRDFFVASGEELLKKITVGDFVDYVTDDDEISISPDFTGAYSEQVLKTDKKVKWKVLHVDSEKDEILITTNEPVNELKLAGMAGYENAVQLIHMICTDLYSCTRLGLCARSMLVEEYQKACEGDIKIDVERERKIGYKRGWLPKATEVKYPDHVNFAVYYGYKNAVGSVCLVDTFKNVKPNIHGLRPVVALTSEYFSGKYIEKATGRKYWYLK